MADRARNAIRGGAALAAAAAGRQVFRLAITILLARLLSPEHFGLVAVISSIYSIATVLQESGLSAATVQRHHVSPQAISTLLWINTGLGAALTLIFIVASPWMATFFGHPEIRALSAVMALSFIFNGTAVQFRAQLQRHTQFARQAGIDFTTALLGGVAALLMASMGWGYWALAVQIVLTDAAALAMLLQAAWFRPMKPRLTPESLDMLRFGVSLLGFGLLYTISQNLYVGLLGKSAGIQAAGIYTRAYALATMPQSMLYMAAGQVALSHLSRLKDSEAEFARFYYRGVQLLALFAVPLAVVFATFPEIIVQCLYGPQWTSVPDLLRLLSPGLAVAPVLYSTGQIFLARGQTQRMLQWGVISAAVTCTATLLGLPWGARGVAIGWSVAVLAQAWPCVIYSFKNTPISIQALTAALRGIYAAALCLIPCALLINAALTGLPVWQHFLLALSSCGVIYSALCYFVFGQKPLIDSMLQSIAGRSLRNS